MKITGTLYSETDAQTTRLYWSEEYNLQLDVVYGFDRQFLINRRKNDNSGLYFLLWKKRETINNINITTQIDYIEQIYIGQSKNVNKRVLQHQDKGKNFEIVCMFTRMDRQLTQTQTTFLEYLAIKEALECGQVFVMENFQVPNKPAIEPEDERKMTELFEIIKLMLSYAGYDEIYRKKKTMIRNEDYKVHRKRTMLDRIAKSSKNNSVNSLHRNDIYETSHQNSSGVVTTPVYRAWCCCEDDSGYYDCCREDEYFDEDDLNDFESNDPSVFSHYDYSNESEVLISYKAIDSSGKFNAYIIPVSGSYMIMPGSIINQKYENLSELGQKLNISDVTDKIKLNDNGKLTIASGFILPTLEDMSILVNNENPDTNIWQMLRQIVDCE